MASEFFVSSDVTFGKNAAKELPRILKEFKAKNVMVVYDAGVKMAGIAEKVLAEVEKADVKVTVFDGVIPNPTNEVVEEAAEIAQRENIDVFVAVGGGSSIDLTKAVNILMTNPGPIGQYGGIGLVKEPVLPLIAIPTTAGTSSEITNVVALTDTKAVCKYVIIDNKIVADKVIADPEFTKTMPAGVTAATGMDALTHAIEGYITVGAWELSDMFHLKAIEIISRSLRGAVENTPEGREGMALGQYVAGMGFSNVGLGIVHSMAHPLGALYDTPHGIANAIILPTVMEYNAEATGEKYRDIAKAMGVEGTENMSQEEYRKAAVDAVRKLSQDVGIPADLKEIVKKEDIPFLAQSAYDDACRPGNPKETSVEDITKLYESLL